MSLDNIINKIKEQAKAEAAKILEEAKSKVKEIEEQSAANLEKLEESVRKEESMIESEIKNAIVLPAKLAVRGEELAQKNNLVERAFRESMEFSDEDYKKVLSYLFKEIPAVSEGIVLPAEGKEAITKNYISENKISVKVGEPVPDIMGGFLLKAGKIEYDCSFVTLLKRIKERLEPEIAPLFV